MIKPCFIGQVPGEVPAKTLGASKGTRFSKCPPPVTRMQVPNSVR